MSLKPQLPIINLGALYANGCVHGVVAGSPNNLSITAGQLRDSTNTFDIVVDSPLTLSTTTSGVGGLDMGTVAVNTFYAVYVIYDVTQANPPAALLSLSSTQPLMPSLNGVTYSHFRLIGYIKTSLAVIDILGFRIIGTGNDRKHMWDNVIKVLSAGTDTVYTPVSLNGGIPNIMGISQTSPASVEVSCVCGITPAAVGNAIALANFNELFSQESVSLSGVVMGVDQIAQLILAADLTITGDYQIKYLLTGTGGTADILISSFTFVI